jgi:uncharacterized protein YndB with AHSA1/START domain
MVAQNSTALQVTLPSDLEIRMTRTFNAPRELIFKAYSSCEHLKHWWGPRKYELASCEMEFRPGGKYRFVHKGPDGEEHGFRGEYREIVEPERIVSTFEWEGLPGHISVDTLTLTEENGVTTYTTNTVFDSKEDRDGMLQSGMEGGANESMERLDEYLQTLNAR